MIPVVAKFVFDQWAYQKPHWQSVITSYINLISGSTAYVKTVTFPQTIYHHLIALCVPGAPNGIMKCWILVLEADMSAHIVITWNSEKETTEHNRTKPLGFTLSSQNFYILILSGNHTVKNAFVLSHVRSCMCVHTVFAVFNFLCLWIVSAGVMRKKNQSLLNLLFKWRMSRSCH